MAEVPHLHSRRSLNLRFDIPISKTKEFWDKLRGGSLVTTKCRKCGEISFPPQADCPNCMAGDPEWVQLGTEAELVTYTHVQTTPASFAGSGAYTIAIAKLREGPKILAWLEGASDAKPGMKLSLVARSSKEGNPYYVFVPA